MMAAPPPRSRGNRRVGALAALAAISMVGAAYAAVPLYAAFCQATGFGGTPRIAATATALRGQRSLVVHLDANVAPGLAWAFEPETSSVTLQTGTTATVYFRVRNREARETAAVAVYNVSPDNAGPWFDKISCFCFSEQHLGPNESAELPVVFFLDPKLEQDHAMDNVGAITLSYTLFAPARPDKPVALAPSGAPAPRL
jgi:cytochrome c oxidase assembly protein subunit 11